MKKLAYWSHQNPWKARIIITMSHIALWSGAIFTGIQLFMEDLAVSQLSITFMSIVFIAAYVLYPIRNTKEGLFKYSFRRRVRHDVILLASSAWVVTGSINHFAYRPIDLHARDIPVTMMVANDVHGIGKKAAKLGMKEMTRKLKDFRKEWKQKLNEQKGVYQEKSKGVKAFLVILTLLFAFGLFLLVGSLACNIGCSGNEGLAWIIMLGGTIGIIFLTIAIIRSIFKKKKVATPAPAPVV